MYLGIDLGTSGVKIVIIDDKQNVITQASAPLSVSRSYPLWSEQNPEDWWQATNQAIQKIKIENPVALSHVKCLGLSGQMHGATLLDENNRILRPAILWNDGRSIEQCKIIEQTVTNARNITGNIAMPGFTAPKLLWVYENERNIFDKIAKVLLPKDYLRFLLCGSFASDMSDSAGTYWLDVKRRQWSEELLACCHLSKEQMPTLFEGHEVTGYLSPKIAKNWGMQSIPIVAGAGDNAAGAVGIDITQPGDAFISLGTSGVYFVSTQNYQPNPEEALHTFCHCLPNTWHQMSVILSSASCLSWLCQLLNIADEEQLLNEVAKLDLTVKSDVTFLPYLSGERTPHNNPHAKGVFFGLSHQTGPAELARAVLEGVAYAFADGQQSIENSGTEIKQIFVIGGGARSRLWGKILASVLNKSLIYRNNADVGPALGAAKLALFANKGSCKQASHLNSTNCNVIKPNEKLVDLYENGYQQYKALYQCLKSQFTEGGK